MVFIHLEKAYYKVPRDFEEGIYEEKSTQGIYEYNWGHIWRVKYKGEEFEWMEMEEWR